MDGSNLSDEGTARPEDALALTQRMSRAGHRATRWVAVWILLYGVGIGIVGIVIGASASPGVVATLMGAWALFVALTVAWSSRQRAAIRGMKTVMAVWAVCFAVCWGVTVVVGSWQFPHVLPWWIGCAIVTVLVHLVVAGWVWRRSVGR